MNNQSPDTSLLRRPRFILIETSRAGNVGAAARAMKTMGLSDLVLVNPRDPDIATHEEAIAFASGAHDILTSVRCVGSLREALDGCNFVAAVSARLREYSPPIISPRAFAQQLTAHPDLSTALIFGNERFGLPNDVVTQSNALINIPANPNYSSLNLAQAVQILAYECRLAIDGDTLPATAIGFRGKLASAEQIEWMYAHLEQGLIAIKFLNATHPKKLMPRLKRLFARTQLEVEEVNILRGIAKKMLTKPTNDD